MKKIKSNILLIIIITLLGVSCQKLDLNPLSEGSTENWYRNEQEIELAINSLYSPTFWFVEGSRLYNTDRFSDDWAQRAYVYDYIAGTITSDWADSKSTWINTYKGIARANSVLNSLDRAKGTVAAATLNRFKAEACFFRASYYSYLIFLYGDVPYLTGNLTIDEAFNTGRTDKNEILKHIYADYDTAALYLPEGEVDGVQRVTKGAAYAFKARTAIWMLDYATAKTAAKQCIDLGDYSLDGDYGKLFLASTNSSPEFIFVIPRSQAINGETMSAGSFLPRLAGGTATAQPSWELLLSYTCTDGLPVDKSPLYDPSNPFKNRDPRLAATMVVPGTAFLGHIYDPGAEKVLDLSSNKKVKNTDSQFGSEYAAFDGLMLKKGVDESWADDKKADPNIIIMRYADVLLMYAEAKMELGELDNSLYDAINLVRARAYGVNSTNTDNYPAVSETNQAKLRTIIRNERHVEFAWENRRWFDLIRWKIAEQALTRPICALPAKKGLADNIASGDYFFPKDTKPVIDENGLVDLTPIINTGKIRVIVPRSFNIRQYLWPIPTDEIKINDNLKQNPGY